VNDVRVKVHVVAETGGEHDYARMAAPLVHAFDASRFEVTTGALSDLGGARALVVATDGPLPARSAASLHSFVRHGGALILLHGTLAAWSGSGPIAEMAAWRPSGPGPLTELVLRPEEGHPVTARLDGGWNLIDELYLSEGPPVNANVLVRASWRFTDQVVAYTRASGAGTFAYVGLGHSPSTYADGRFHKLVTRLVASTAAPPAGPPAGAGLLGYGAIGREHAAAIAATPGLRLAAVADLSAARRDDAARDWPVRGYAGAEELLEDPDVAFVVVGTPPSTHADAVLAALRAGKHVVCEKPFSLRVEEADRMIDAARSAGRSLTVYQSRRWDPDFVAMREAIRSGAVGDPFYMESFIGGREHPCDLWHSHEPISGGTIYDWGSHYFDWMLQIFTGHVRSVSAVTHKLVWHDVTNADQVRVEMSFEGGAQATFMQSEIAYARKPKWYLLGTRGAVVADWADAPVPSDFPARVTVFRDSGEERLRLGPRDAGGFYRNLADHLAWGEALAVPAEEARRNVAVMAAATESIARGGAGVQVDV
jgi:predicted dehydrogenase